MQNNVVYHINQAHTYEASWYGIDSAHLFNKYKLDNYNFIEIYSPRDVDKEKFSQLSNLFCVMHAQNYHVPAQQMFHSLKPLYTLRYMIHEDLSVSEYDTPKRKPGNVVEALCWTNGMIFRVREDKKEEEFRILQLGLYLAPLTAKLLGINHDTSTTKS